MIGYKQLVTPRLQGWEKSALPASLMALYRVRGQFGTVNELPGAV